MVQILTVCRIGTEWAFRDVTGAEYARSSDIKEVVEAAQRMAQRAGSQVQFTAEAEEAYRSACAAGSDMTHADPSPKGIRRRFRSGFLSRLFARKRMR